MKRKSTIPLLSLALVLAAAGLALVLLMHRTAPAPERTSPAAAPSGTASAPIPENVPQAGDTRTDPSSDGPGQAAAPVPEGAQKIGFLIGNQADLPAEIAEAFGKEGFTVLRSFEMPETPETVPVYTAVNRENDALRFMRAVFGDGVEYETQTLAEHQGLLYEIVRNGTEYQLVDQGTFRDGYRRLAVRRRSLPAARTTDDPAAEARRFAEALTADPWLGDFHAEPGDWYSCLYQTSLTACRQYAGAYPVSSVTYYIEEDDDTWNIEGSSLTVEFDAWGLNGVELRRPLSVTETGEPQRVAISAEAAVESAVRKIKDRLPGHRVIDLRGVSLEYLAPAHDEERMVPVWVISYDLYENSLRKGAVESDLGELVVLVDVQTGYIYPIYL